MASAVHSAGMELCSADARAGKFKTAMEAIECQLAVDRSFVTAVRLQKMELFAVYERRMRLAATEMDAGRLSSQEMSDRLSAIRADFRQQVDMAYATDQAERARLSAGLMAMGAGMQAAGASYNAGAYGYVPPTRPVICNTTPGRLDGAGGATTICH